jgi:hypothetical protein
MEVSPSAFALLELDSCQRNYPGFLFGNNAA